VPPRSSVPAVGRRMPEPGERLPHVVLWHDRKHLVRGLTDALLGWMVARLGMQEGRLERALAEAGNHELVPFALCREAVARGERMHTGVRCRAIQYLSPNCACGRPGIHVVYGDNPRTFCAGCRAKAQTLVERRRRWYDARSAVAFEGQSNSEREEWKRRNRAVRRSGDMRQRELLARKGVRGGGEDRE
jgi:hypothetical protein